MLLGVVSGLAGNLVKTLIDEVSRKNKISQRTFRETAAGVWVNKRSEATNYKGQLLGGLLDFGLASLGGIGTVQLFSKTGRDCVLTKGILSGITVGSTVTAFMSALPQNKVKPKDAASNLSYMLAHAVYGVVTAALVTKLGDPSLFDSKPVNNYLSPTEPTTEEMFINRRQAQ
ncbi:hypothetical protein SPSYN_02820 [Sporotomaculum syntrophicum]|uniref:Uncharacterized protein n=1 Tax=Sporotomaculum syntrophicum TaxID=182264 RepID=A0A9D3AXQ9_9FIRM|nr:hypothetical protein [Sporotomaculum syntrophicum]KAF1083908.1 hypothetical protein SPSYN_02820 [Sporotomaculum syntrophicum]